MTISLKRALLLLLGGTVLVALIPGGLVLDRRLTAELERAARDGLSIAPRLLEDRNAARADALMMHAKDLAASTAVVAAFRSLDAEAAVRAAREARFEEREEVVVVSGRSEELWAGPMPDDEMLDATRAGQMPVSFLATPAGPAHVALAPVMDEDAWIGAAGVFETLDGAGVAALAGLTRAEVLIESPLLEGVIATLDSTEALALLAAVPDDLHDGAVVEVVVADGSRWWVAQAPLGGTDRALFARSVEEELSVLPRLRRGAALAAGSALLLALLLGTLAAGAVARPVHALAGASERLTQGDFDAPLPRSSVREVDRVAQSFAEMRSALERRLEELEEANATLATQQERLQALQGDLIQRDRLETSGRLVAELAHEIRNPVASIRNCLEVLDRRLAGDEEGRVFARLAIEELARMHELAEGLLDLNRPADPEASGADPAAVSAQVAAFMAAGSQGSRWPIELDVPADTPAVAIAPDALKQVLINLVQNAQEAMLDGGTIQISGKLADDRVIVTVADHGPGIPEDMLARIFDPFFTTKGEVRGVGLGLFIAEGIVRRYGGILTAGNRMGGTGALFTLELPAEEAGGL
ncbi:MAG: HAMP domain-containing protein [Gemmatimonadetes bacterium]|nr:HAMP domain-containing protein [Gemmatimonadota bacterium]